MHKGRTYPFHPDYWSTQGWFWPGYVPWKMHCLFNGFDGLPWDYIGIGYEAISEVGFHSPDYKLMVYEWDLSLFPPLVAMAVTLVFDDSLPTWYSRFAVVIVDTVSTIFAAQAFDYQTFPQRQVLCGGFTSSEPQPPYTYTGPVDLIFRPATYTEGGSPWL